MRLLVAAIVGGILVFFWGFVSHVVLPIGEMGISTIPNEDAVLATLQKEIPKAGLYLFPGEGMGGEMTPEQLKEWERKYTTGPAGLLSYRPIGGTKIFDPRQLGMELASNILACLVAAFLVSLIPGSYLRRVLAVAVLGLFAWFSVSFSHWTWYGFPFAYTLAEGIDQTVSFVLAGLVLAKIVPAEAAAGS